MEIGTVLVMLKGQHFKIKIYSFKPISHGGATIAHTSEQLNLLQILFW